MRSNLYKAYTIISRGKLPWLRLSCFLSRLQSKDVTDQSTYVSLFNVVFFLGRTRNPLSPSSTSVRSQSVPQPDKSMGEIQMVKLVHKWALTLTTFLFGMRKDSQRGGSSTTIQCFSTEPQRLLKSYMNGQRQNASCYYGGFDTRSHVIQINRKLTLDRRTILNSWLFCCDHKLVYYLSSLGGTGEPNPGSLVD